MHKLLTNYSTTCCLGCCCYVILHIYKIKLCAILKLTFKGLKDKSKVTRGG